LQFPGSRQTCANHSGFPTKSTNPHTASGQEPAVSEPPASDYERFHHYLPIPDGIFHSGLYVTSAGRAVVRPGERYPPVRHPSLYQFDWAEGRILPEFSLILITAGHGAFESRQTSRVALDPGTVALLFPGVWHRYRPERGTGWTEKWVQFNGEFVHRLVDANILSPGRPVLHPAGWEQVEAALDQLLERIHRQPAANSLLLSLHAMRALSLVLDAVSDPAEIRLFPRRRASEDPLVASALDYVWTRSHHVLSVQDVADHLGVTRRTLERRMAAACRQTVLDAIIQCRFNRAERLLRETALPVTAVVRLAGFGSAENMRQCFLQRTKLSPRGYRQRHRPLAKRAST